MPVPPGAGQSRRRIRHPPLRVLIVDNVRSTRRVVCDLLERRGYRIAGEATSGAAAIAAVASLTPDAVLLDVHLNDQSGFRVASAISTLRPALPVLLTATEFEDGFYALARESGATGFVPKSLLGRVEFTRFWPSSRRRRAAPG